MKTTACLDIRSARYEAERLVELLAARGIFARTSWVGGGSTGVFVSQSRSVFDKAVAVRNAWHAEMRPRS